MRFGGNPSLLITFVILFNLLYFGLTARSRKEERVGKAAKKIKRDMAAMYGERHEYAEVDLSNGFPRADLKFYTETAADLSSLGFRHLGYIEDLTLSRIHPNMRTVISLFGIPDGTISSAVYHVRPGGALMMLVQLLGLMPRNIYAVDIETELSDGSFICTTRNNMKHNLDASCPGLFGQYFPATTPLHELLRLHRAAVAERTCPEQGLVPLPTALTLADNRESQHRQNALKGAHRREKGYITGEEVQRLSHPSTKEAARELGEEIDRMNDEERGR